MNKEHSEQLHLEMPFTEAIQRFSKVNIRDLSEIESTNGNPKSALPFVKWAGGKRSIINDLTSRLPKKFNNYYEPFVGGGALFFEIHKSLKQAFLSDSNIDLILTYSIIKKDVTQLIQLLKKHDEKHNATYYTKIRNQHTLQDPIEIAARFLYLNKTCYNGLYRVNKKGEFNVPIGSNEAPNIIAEKNLIACNKAFKHVKIEYKDYLQITPGENDFVYFDPPYHPTAGNFTGYTKFDFTEKDQLNLRDFILTLHKKNVKIMLSNSNTDYIREIYNNKIFTINTVKAPRFINCKPKERNHVVEVIITNYLTDERKAD